ncbi:MAG: threonine/serine exporter family protein [Rothia sp. (in: high G+C Gram-positive bacteria)]|uniref:threonine/serine ThrE exporter family protein n=1 Tax=Rothia sp. (in: high G+C Gram-positive bacteria) TaxID=1885016 RepID=UPI0026DF35E4|nr:threonine/serine exporter family protein [Rothia sp. (in: high G+C Gram-positive bacteria)]MDO5751070.1 threonine/serine exporter family protein [Rothia sp. (in: high G+C Gram-positive bacteria)]
MEYTDTNTYSIYLGSSREQHKHIVAQSQVVLRLGRILMKSGASAYRIKASMARLAKAIGLDEHHAQVTFTELSTSAYANGNFRTEVAEQRTMGINSYKIDQLGVFISNLPEKITPAQAEAELDRIDSMPHLYTRWMLTLASGIACAAFAFLNRGGYVECFAVLLAAGAGQYLRSTMIKRGINHMAIWMLCGFLSTSLYVGVVASLSAAGLIGPMHMVGFISSILYLVPGFPMVTGMLDIARMDFLAGIARLTYVTVLLVSASFSVWVMITIYHLPLAQNELPPMPYWLYVMLLVLASAIAAMGFAMLFAASHTAVLWAGVIAGIANTARILLVNQGWTPYLAAVLAVFTVGIMAEVIAPLHKRRYSRISLSVPAVVTMVPGVPFYTAMSHLSMGDMNSAVGGLAQSLLVFLALGLGLAFVRLLFDKNWIFDQDTQVMRKLDTERHMR